MDSSLKLRRELSGLGIHIKPFNDSFFKDLICTTTASISSGETPDCHDLELAIQNGATFVRVGSDIFGKRD
jgi:uncharacterized pyridoxal phosphate-containing UPF0001 family protein